MVAINGGGKNVLTNTHIIVHSNTYKINEVAKFLYLIQFVSPNGSSVEQRMIIKRCINTNKYNFNSKLFNY